MHNGHAQIPYHYKQCYKYADCRQWHNCTPRQLPQPPRLLNCCSHRSWEPNFAWHPGWSISCAQFLCARPQRMRRRHRAAASRTIASTAAACSTASCACIHAAPSRTPSAMQWLTRGEPAAAVRQAAVAPSARAVVSAAYCRGCGYVPGNTCTPVWSSIRRFKRKHSCACLLTSIYHTRVAYLSHLHLVLSMSISALHCSN